MRERAGVNVHACCCVVHVQLHLHVCMHVCMQTHACVSLSLSTSVHTRCPSPFLHAIQLNTQSCVSVTYRCLQVLSLHLAERHHSHVAHPAEQRLLEHRNQPATTTCCWLLVLLGAVLLLLLLLL